MISFQNINQYQQFFTALVQKEREAEIQQQLNEISLLTGQERQKKGRAILRLSGRDAGTGLGGISLIKLVNTKGLPDTEIGIGDLVILSKGTPTGKEAQATVIEKTQHSITIGYTQLPPHYATQPNLRLDLFANDITFQRMIAAIKAIPKNGSLKGWLLNESAQGAPLHREMTDEVSQSLNSVQQKAVEETYLQDGPFLVHGPPGTGKTTTLVEIIRQLALGGHKLLVTADSNTAVDNLVEKLYQLQLSVIRIGNPARTSEALLPVVLDYKIQDHPDYQQAITLWDDVHQLKGQQQEEIPPTGQHRRGLSDRKIMQAAAKKQAVRGIPDFKIRKMARWLKLQEQINAKAEEAIQLQDKAVHEFLDNTAIVCCTNSTAGSEVLRDFSFDYSIIDEATQSTEPSCLIAMTKAKRWMMAGDHHQLPPTVIHPEARALSATLFERWMQSQQVASQLLTIQYRMHEEIMRFSNETFYQGALHAHPTVKSRTLASLSGYQLSDYLSPAIKSLIAPLPPVIFQDVQDGKEKQLADSHSFYNEEEIVLVQQLVEGLLTCRLFPKDIGVISPYLQQVKKLQQVLTPWGVEVKSVDGFQGREKEVILFSCVRANKAGTLGFLTDYRRLNVALTRAKRKLIIVGHQVTLSHDAHYRKLIDWYSLQGTQEKS